ncbi:MAG: HEAT repeat domain-containing protein [Myxococcaceae bacterium]|nr:HEAT repeat domain-containing protein [Myxococcaceae bacterium]
MRRALLALGGGLLLTVVACKREPPLRFSSLELLSSELVSSTELGLSGEAVEAKLAAALKAKGLTRVEKDDAAAVRLKGALGLHASEATEDSTTELEGVLAAKAGGQGVVLEVRAVVAADASGDLEDRRGKLQSATDQLLGSLAGQLAAGLRARGLDADALAKELTDKDPLRQRAAAGALAERKDPRALPALLAALRTDDVDQLRQVLGQLITLGDAAAVPDIIEAARGKDAVFQREVVFALSALGGDEAEAYLDVMAQGSDQALMRESAQRALEELRRKHHPRPKEPAP